jgi:hypothetical protein
VDLTHGARAWDARGQVPPSARHTSALDPANQDFGIMYLTAEDIVRRLRGTRALRSVRRDVATWARGGWPRVERIPRPAGGWQWGVRAEDYDRWANNQPPPPEARN